MLSHFSLCVFADLLNGAQEKCEVPSLDGFPHCEGKVKVSHSPMHVQRRNFLIQNYINEKCSPNDCTIHSVASFHIVLRLNAGDVFILNPDRSTFLINGSPRDLSPLPQSLILFETFLKAINHLCFINEGSAYILQSTNTTREKLPSEIKYLVLR